MTEQEYKEQIYSKADKVRTKEDLDKLLAEVTSDEALDYGKIVYAISGCMIATCNFIDRSEVGGITGFQAGCIGWEMIKEFLITHNEMGMRLVDYDEMLYPQYKGKFKKTISPDKWEKMRKKAEQLLKETPFAHPKVIKHWKSIARGKVPFGFKIEKKKKEKKRKSVKVKIKPFIHCEGLADYIKPGKEKNEWGNS